MDQLFQNQNTLLFFQGSNVWLLLIALWQLPWKGVALWKAARMKDTVWFVVLLVVNTLAILEILYIFFFSKRTRIEAQIDTRV